MKRSIWFLLGFFLAASVIVFATTWSFETKDPNYPQQQPYLVAAGTATLSAVADNNTITLPTSFNSTDYGVVWSILAADITSDSLYVSAKAAGTFTFYGDSSGTIINWIAVGNAPTW